MKKILLLLCTLLGTVGASAAITKSTVQGSQVTSAEGIVDGGKYVVRVNGGSYITEDGTQYAAPNTQNAISDNAVFTFHQNGDSWTVENETTGNYWGTLPSAATNNFSPVEAASAGSWTFTFNGNNIVFTSGGYNINRSSGVMHGWGSTIALQIYNIEEVNLVGAISDFSNTKAYYVKTADRGAWFVAEGGTAITSTSKAGFAASKSDTKQQFAFLTYGTTGVYHLYSVSEGKFVSRGDEASQQRTKLTAELGDNVTLLSTSNTNYPFVVALQDGAYQMGISNGYDPAVITFWNDLTDGGNQVQIQEVADFDPTAAMAILEETYGTTVTVTYELYESDGTTLVDTKIAIQDKNSEVSVPASLMNSYFTYATEGTIGTTDCTIKVTRTVNAGIVYPISNLSNSKSYYIKTRNNARSALSTYTDGETTYLASPVKDALGISPKKFAIISYEDNYYLYSVDDAKFVTYSESQKAPLADMVTGTSDRINFSETTTPLYGIRFDDNASRILNSSAQYTYGLVMNAWGGASSQWDDGCQYTIEEADDFDATNVIAAMDAFFHPTNYYDKFEAEVLPYLVDGENPAPSLGKPFGLTIEAFYDIMWDYYSQIKEGVITAEEYEEIIAIKDAGIIYPADGYYFVKNATTNKYLRAISVGARNGVVADVVDPSTVPAAVIEVRTVDGKQYMLSNNAWLNWVYPANGNEGMASEKLDKYVHWFAGAAGQGLFSIAYGNGEGDFASYLATGYYTALGDENGTIWGGNGSSASAQWIFEPATDENPLTLTLALNTVGDASYATAYLPFGVTLGGDVKAYALTYNAPKTHVVPAEIGSDVPAGTPVLLVSETGAESVTATISDVADVDITNELAGSYFASTPEAYVLNNGTEGVGFYVLNGTLAANRAYLPKTSEVKGFALSWGAADAINDIVNGTSANGKWYNLAGQRVEKASKGIFIVNGKKVVIK